jgi:Uma2 family endonuclease
VGASALGRYAVVMGFPQPKTVVSVADYLEIDRTSEAKLALWNGETFAMAGGSPAHNLLVAAALGEFRNQLRGNACRPYGSDQRIRLPALDRYVYPDASVTCPPVEIDPLDANTICNPAAIVEVLSDSTEAFDRGEKFAGYRSIQSMTDYILISQNVARIEHYSRQQDGSWILRSHENGSSVALARLNVTLSVSELYAGVL